MYIMHRIKIAFKKRTLNKRALIQMGSLIAANSYVLSFLKFCPAPVLNCHACPLAVMACPIGSLQRFVGQRKFPFVLSGFFIVIGALIGRMLCGWACPFGFLQDILFKIKIGKKKLLKKTEVGLLNLIRYPIFAGLVLIGPYVIGEPLFCKLCPAGSLEAGVPLVIMEPWIRSMAGTLFVINMIIILTFIVSSIFIKRPFCRFICPLGTIYSPFNKISLMKLNVDKGLCNKCEACSNVCPVGLDPYLDANSPDCIRCLDCKFCPAIKVKFGG